MTISPEDLNAFEAFVAGRGKRNDMGPEYVRAQIKRLNGLIDNSKQLKTPNPKQKNWETQLQNMQRVERVMAIQLSSTTEENAHG